MLVWNVFVCLAFLLFNLNSFCFTDETTLVLLDNFSVIFKNRTLPKSTGVKGTWRASKGEVQNSFFLHIKVSFVLPWNLYSQRLFTFLLYSFSFAEDYTTTGRTCFA